MLDTNEVSLVGLVRGGEQYVICYTDDNVREALQTLGRWAANPKLSFTWYDAAVMAQKIRRDQRERG